MNTITRLKTAFIRRSLDKRRSLSPFILDLAELYSLPPDSLPSKNNSYYFSAHDASETSLLFRFAKRGGGINEIWFAYKTKDNAYINEIQLYKGEAPAFIQCLKTGEKWEFGWTGELQEKQTKRKAFACFKGAFTASAGVFDFGHDMDSGVMAEAIAKRKWSSAFFRELKENDQVHYEQPGILTGELEIDGKKIQVNMPAMRDHSYGKREWKYMNRHYWITALFEDGGSFNVNMASYPVLDVKTGYMISEGKTVSVKSATITGKITQHEVPEKFDLNITLSDGRKFNISCLHEDTFVFPFEEGAYMLYEGIGSFFMDGVKGRGVLEFGWNKDASRYGGSL